MMNAPYVNRNVGGDESTNRGRVIDGWREGLRPSPTPESPAHDSGGTIWDRVRPFTHGVAAITPGEACLRPYHTGAARVPSASMAAAWWVL